MNKAIFLGLVNLLAITACAQQSPVALKYSHLITAEDARKHLSILASDAFEGRETGQPGADKAASYLAAEFKKMGLQPGNKGSYFFNVPLTQPVFTVNHFTINGEPLTYGTDFYNYSTPTESNYINDFVVFIGYGTPAELNTDITNKTVVMIGDEKPGTATTRRRGLSPGQQKIINDIKAKHPRIILSISASAVATAAERAKRSGARLLLNDDIKEGYVRAEDFKPAAIFNITPQVADKIFKRDRKTYAELKQAVDAGSIQTQALNANIDIDFTDSVKDVKAVDVVAMIPGSDPKLKDEVLVFSAHYDHIGLTTEGTDKVNNGADDDGSGTTGILEIAQAFAQAKKDGHGPRRTILFLGNVGEEKGLLGSEYYTNHPVFPMANTIADLNIDMIGRVGYEYQHKADSANYVYVIGSGMLSSTLRKISENSNKAYTHLDLDYKYDDPNDPNRFYYRSDHYNFARYGVPIIFYFNGVHDDYHQPGDEISKINFPLLAKRAKLVFFTGWELANRDARPAVDVK